MSTAFRTESTSKVIKVIQITGMKFIAITDSKQQNVEPFLRKTYEIYADYALKNPWYIF